MWQYTGSGRVEGIEGKVDLDICYSDYPKKIKSKGLNGFKKSSNSVKGDVNNDGKVDVRDSAKIAKDLAERKKLSKQADFNNDGKANVRDASAIAKSLSKKKNKKSVDEIAREVIQGKWGNGEERKKKLTSAGYSYEEVQSVVNKLV